MAFILRTTQLVDAISAAFTLPPVIIGLPIIAPVTVGQAVTFSNVSGVVGFPTPTVQYDLYKNGNILYTSYVSGTYLAEAVGDQLTIVATASNGIGTPAIVVSLAVSVTASLPAGAPVWQNQTPGYSQSMSDATVNDLFVYPLSATNSPTSYALASGSLPPGVVLSSVTPGRLVGRPTTAGSYTFTINATNAVNVTTSSNITVTVNYRPRLKQAPVVGVPLYYEIPGFTGTITSQQWYSNPGTGPVAISGATSSTYTPVSGDVGSWLSVRCVTSVGNMSSNEFSASNTVISQTTILNGSDTASYIGSQHNGVTTLAPAVVRAYYGSRYIETSVAPGTYTSSQIGNLTAYATDFGSSVAIQRANSMPAVVAPVTKAAATATRPTANTGTGNFVKNGALYDNNGNKLQLRGINWTHYDNPAYGIFNTGTNAIRFETYIQNAWSGNKATFDNMVSKKVVPIIANFANASQGMTATVSGNTLTLQTRTFGYLYVGVTVSMSGLPGGKAKITSIGTTNGGLGDYTIDGAGATISTPQTLTIFDYTTSNPSAQCLQTMGRNWVDVAGNFSQYDKYSIINIANEWGPSATSTNTVWRDTYGYKDSNGNIQAGVVQQMRAAGYQGCFMIDAPGSGQNTYALINHAAAVLAGDPLQNIIFSFHIYGSTKVGQLAGYLDQMRATGITVIVGEFGPGYVDQYDAISSIDPLEIAAIAESRDSGWAAWAWDDHRSGTVPDFENSYALCYDWVNGYSTSNPADLKTYGKKVVLDPIYGTSVSVKTTTV